MNEITIGISSIADASRRFLNAFNTGKPQGSRISFESEEQFWKILTFKRWQLLKIMTGAGELTIREVARRINRDIKSVHGDIQVLLNCGLIDKVESGKIVFPYDRIHVDFMLQAA